MLLESLYKMSPEIFVNGSVLVEMLPFCPIHKACGRHKLHVYLDALSGALHLLIRLCDVFGVGRLCGQNALPPQEAVKTSDGLEIAALYK